MKINIGQNTTTQSNKDSHTNKAIQSTHMKINIGQNTTTQSHKDSH